MALTFTEYATQSTGGTLSVKAAVWADTLGMFVATGSGGTGWIYTSTDGSTWLSHAAAAAKTWRGLAWSPSLGLLVAVCSTTTNSSQVMTSTDGINWFLHTSAETNQWNSVVWADALNLFVAVSTTGTHRVMTSSDGINWFPQTASAASQWSWITWSGSLLVVGSTTLGVNSIMTSADGIAWFTQTTPIAASIRGVGWAPVLGLFAAACDDDNHLLTSSNGTIWTDWSGLPAGWSYPTNANHKFAWSPELSLWIMTAGFSSSIVLTTPDGVVWTATDTGDFRIWDAIAYSPTILTFALFDQGAHDIVLAGVNPLNIIDDSVAFSVVPSYASGVGASNAVVIDPGGGVGSGGGGSTNPPQWWSLHRFDLKARREDAG